MGFYIDGVNLFEHHGLYDLFCAWAYRQDKAALEELQNRLKHIVSREDSIWRQL